jgi:gamma-glutamyltranspeptidase/glutathione hydrolase
MRAIEACGFAGQNVSVDLYKQQGLDSIPARGPLAANTVAGTVGGWAEAYRVSGELGGTLPLSRLLQSAIGFAANGVPASENQHRLTVEKLDSLRSSFGFVEQYLHDGEPPEPKANFVQSRLAQTLRTIADEGPESFYRGDLARRIAADLEQVGSPIVLQDLHEYSARRVEPLSLRISKGTVYNMPPPTQGVASLMILGMFDRIGVESADNFEHVHTLVEATKQAFRIRDAQIGDPDSMQQSPDDMLSDATLDRCAGAIDLSHAAPWDLGNPGGDTVWLGAIDTNGCAVSFIQSIFWEFGSGVVLPETGILWQNRGSSFSLDDGRANSLVPGRRPFHTLNPAIALLDDGRVMVYGTMGGDGQPQTQAAVFTRHVYFDQGLQDAISAPRWLLGRTWGDESVTLKLESRFDEKLVSELRGAGHDVETVGAFDDLMGHAGAVVRYPDGTIEGAADPRSDGITPN